MRSNKLFHQEGEASEFTDYRVSQATFTSRDHRISDNRVRKDGRVFDVNIESRKNSKFELFRWRQVGVIKMGSSRWLERFYFQKLHFECPVMASEREK